MNGSLGGLSIHALTGSRGSGPTVEGKAGVSAVGGKGEQGSLWIGGFYW